MPRRSLVLSVVVLAACAGDEREGFDVDAALYIESFCETDCERNRDCGSDFYTNAEECRERCIVSVVHDMDDNRCFELQFEYARCRFDQLPCDEVFDNDPDGDPGTVCEDEYAEWVLCLGQ